VHLACIGLVVVAGEVQESVEHQYLELHSQGVATRSALAPSGGDADRQIACDPFRGLWVLEGRGGKRKNVGGFVLAAKALVEVADGLVGGEQGGDLTAQPDGGLGPGKKAGESA
jgi:hypothetical protein